MRARPAGISALRSAAALADAAATAARKIPAPRGLPFYGLDHPPGLLDRALAHLSDLGIFRIYSHVLDLAGRLGGPGRWLARRHACRVTAVEPDLDLASASALLTARAFLADSVRTVAASAEHLPFASGTFTHSWRVFAAGSNDHHEAMLAEAWRTLRPGGWLALAERGDSAARSAMSGSLERAGFREIVVTDLAPLLEDESTAARLTAERAEGVLGSPLLRLDEERSGDLFAVRARKPS